MRLGTSSPKMMVTSVRMIVMMTTEMLFSVW